MRKSKGNTTCETTRLEQYSARRAQELGETFFSAWQSYREAHPEKFTAEAIRFF